MSRASLLRSNLLGCLATLDSFFSAWLCLFSIKGNLWLALFPPGWPRPAALSCSVGDLALLVGLRWVLCTTAGAGGGYMLSLHGLLATAAIHTSCTALLAFKIAAALRLLKDPGPDLLMASEIINEGDGGPEARVILHTLIAAEAFGILAAWCEFLITVGSLALLRHQLQQDCRGGGGGGGSGQCTIRQAPEAQPLLALGPDGSPRSGRPSADSDGGGARPWPEPARGAQRLQGGERLQPPPLQAYVPPPPPPGLVPAPLPVPAASAAHGTDEQDEDEDEFFDARSDCSFQSLASSTASYATAATHATRLSSLSSASSPSAFRSGRGSLAQQ